MNAKKACSESGGKRPVWAPSGSCELLALSIQNHSGRGEVIFLLSLFKKEVKKKNHKRCRNILMSLRGETQVTTNSGCQGSPPPHNHSSALKGGPDNNQMPSHVNCPEATPKHPAHQRIKAAKEPDAAALKISSAAWHL